MEQRDSQYAPPQQTPADRIKLNVGGKLFETTVSTLQSAGPDSLLAALSTTAPSVNPHPIFIDRDPDVFTVLLSVLRSNRLPSTSRRFSKQELAEEALYYGVESRLRAAMAPPPLSGIDASHVSTVRPAADGFVSAFSAGSQDGSVWIAHGGQISAYDWILSHVATVRTHLDEITSLRRAWPEIAVVGSMESPGLHFYDVVSGGRHIGSVNWTDPSDPRVYKARVTSIAAEPEPDPEFGSSSSSSGGSSSVFAAFECPHRENCILAIDKATLKVASEIGRQNGSSMKTAVPGKLALVPEQGLIFASAVSAGAFGYSGYMRLWDPRSGAAVWETTEPGSGSSSSRFGDSFADADADLEESAIYKVCWKSGDVAVADMRKLGEDPWVYMEERSAGLRNAGGGEGSVVHCYKKQVFVSREGGLEVWSQVDENENENERKGIGERVMRRNLVDREEDGRRGVIRKMEGGGERLFLSREGVEGIEVWESSDQSAAIAAAAAL